MPRFWSPTSPFELLFLTAMSFPGSADDDDADDDRGDVRLLERSRCWKDDDAPDDDSADDETMLTVLDVVAPPLRRGSSPIVGRLECVCVEPAPLLLLLPLATLRPVASASATSSTDCVLSLHCERNEVVLATWLPPRAGLNRESCASVEEEDPELREILESDAVALIRLAATRFVGRLRNLLPSEDAAGFGGCWSERSATGASFDRGNG